MNTNILSFNICKLDTTWPMNRCMQIQKAQSVKTIQYRSQCYKNLACNVFSCVNVFCKLKLTSKVEENHEHKQKFIFHFSLYAHIFKRGFICNCTIFIHHISWKKFKFSAIHTSRKRAYTKTYRTQKLINQFLNQVEYQV